jgi:DNA-binding transcriptional ArsR family regulator
MDNASSPSNARLVAQLGALASPHRLAILAVLARGRVHVSGLAREIGLSRPLTHMHLKRLEEAGLVRGSLELSDDGKAMKFFEPTGFRIVLTPDDIARALTEEAR